LKKKTELGHVTLILFHIVFRQLLLLYLLHGLHCNDAQSFCTLTIIDTMQMSLIAEYVYKLLKPCTRLTVIIITGWHCQNIHFRTFANCCCVPDNMFISISVCVYCEVKHFHAEFCTNAICWNSLSLKVAQLPVRVPKYKGNKIRPPQKKCWFLSNWANLIVRSCKDNFDHIYDTHIKSKLE